MKIAIITTAYLESFVRSALAQLRCGCETQLFIYQDFSHVGELYLSLEDRFDGFLVSGPVPRQAILKRAHSLHKPIEDFGTDLQSYYETFFTLVYRYGLDLERGYIDLMDWCPGSQPLSHYLAEGTFGQFYQQLTDNLRNMSLAEIARTEKLVLQKHLYLWENRLIDFSTTRFSSIAPILEERGVNYYFIYPHIFCIQSALDSLLQKIRLQQLQVSQPAVIQINLKTGPEGLPPQELAPKLERLPHVLREFSKKHLADFKVQPTPQGCTVYTSFKTVRELTSAFHACQLKPYIQERLGTPVCVGYGVGDSLGHAAENAATANTESNIDSANASYLVNERDEILGPLVLGKQRTVSSRATPYVVEMSQKTGLSTLTVQKLLTAMELLGTNQVTPQSLAAALNVTVRSANRFLSALLRHGQAQISHQRQNASRGRPERVYLLLLDPALASGPQP